MLEQLARLDRMVLLAARRDPICRRMIAQRVLKSLLWLGAVKTSTVAVSTCAPRIARPLLVAERTPAYLLIWLDR
jgi:hypothetical protein